MDHPPAPRPRKPPTPGSWKPGTSGNPHGRPRKGDALADAIRSQVSPEDLIAVARAVIDDGSAPASVKLQAATFLAERGYARPSERLELVGGVSDEQLDLSRHSLDQLARLEEIEAERAAIIAAPAGAVPELPAPHGAPS